MHENKTPGEPRQRFTGGFVRVLWFSASGEQRVYFGDDVCGFVLFVDQAVCFFDEGFGDLRVDFQCGLPVAGVQVDVQFVFAAVEFDVSVACPPGRAGASE